MRFADKLFLATTALLTVMFALFGTWMLSSDFSQLLNKEIEQGNNDSRTFHFLFEMGYQSTEEYGEDYAISKTLNSIADSVERDERHMFAIRDDGTYFYGGDYLENMGFAEEVDGLIRDLNTSDTTEDSIRNIGIRKIDGSYYMFAIAKSGVSQSKVYLGICRELTDTYDSRGNLLSRYRIALLCLLSAGGVCIYFLSRYITRPIRSLGRLASRIADGDYTLRSQNKSSDEIGALARDFNRMADRLVEEMQIKIREAKQKEDFTAAFAHELKTPLTSIIGYADMLNSLKLTEEECHDAYFYIYNQGKRLENLSHKLLDLVSMDKNPLTFRTVSTKDLEQNLRITMRPIWKQRGVRGKVDMEKAFIQGDAELLLSLLYNLLDNAVKALDKGEESFMLMKGSCLKGFYEIKVVDNGRGIPAEEISRITEAFYMVDKSRSRKEGGAGIGMALCQKIIQLHSGTLVVDSRLGEGTVIKVTFPREENHVKGEKAGHGR
ncbi:MAG: HAMP domain-containing histidine kinase [Lachnospiraceae bacterium]|nr:HAMP domain-containing histidine kinase [Lachnospiraceae bacterium]